jgi:hypothetical protein
MRRCALALWLACLAVLAGLAVACAVDPDCVRAGVLAPVCAFCALGGGTAGCVAVCAEK